MPFNPPTVSTIARGTQALQIPRSVNDSEGGASPTLRPEHTEDIALAGACRVRHRAGNDPPASPRVTKTRARCLAVFRARGCLAPLPSPSSTRGADAWHRSHLARRRPASSGSHLRARRAHHTLPRFSEGTRRPCGAGVPPAFQSPSSREHLTAKSHTHPETWRPLSIAMAQRHCDSAPLRLCVQTAMAAMKSVLIRVLRVPFAMVRWKASGSEQRPITHPAPSAPHAPRSRLGSWC